MGCSLVLDGHRRILALRDRANGRLTVGMAMRKAMSVPRQSAEKPSRRAILRMPSNMPWYSPQFGLPRWAHEGGHPETAMFLCSANFCQRLRTMHLYFRLLRYQNLTMGSVQVCCMASISHAFY